MSFQSSVSFVNPPQNFIIRTPNPQQRLNSAAPLVTSRCAPLNLGQLATGVPVSAIVGNTFVVIPTGADNSVAGIIYTLPTAQQILAAFGEELGISKLSAGDQLNLRVVNKAAAPAYIVGNVTGSDGTAIVAFPAGAENSNALSYTGAYGVTQGTGAAAKGRITDFVLEFTAVNSGSNGATGVYTVYA